jgi:CubicO group peptidase (beta-lactamase class C family)
MVTGAGTAEKINSSAMDFLWRERMMNRRKQIAVLILLLLSLKAVPSAQSRSVALPRSIPEAEGVSSEGILRFIEAVGSSKHELHSFMFLRHGKVIAEGWWHPYRPDLKHTMYSTSKSFTSTAVGFAVSEKRLTVNDKVISVFPNDLPETVSPNLAEMRVKDLLMMAAGHDTDPTRAGVISSNWVKTFLATPVVHKPGTKFLYNTLATYMLSAIVQKVTGQNLMNYLTPRLFKPLGIEGADWEADPQGVKTGGWGLRIKTEDMAKFGQLYLQKGRWNGKQILPAQWIAEATSSGLRQGPQWASAQTRTEDSDWLQGYGYQIWRCRHHAFRADGSHGQFIIVMPEQDAVIAITAETTDMQGEINLIWDHLLPAMKPGKLPVDANAVARLRSKLAALSLPVTRSAENAAMQKAISGKVFSIEPNEKQMQSLAFQFGGNRCEVVLKTDVGSWQLSFGANGWLNGTTTRRGPYLLPMRQSDMAWLSPFKVAGNYAWKDANTLELVLRYIESPHRETIVCRFEGNNLSAEVFESLEAKPKKTLLKGVLQE